jgi:1-acyl-sn-glycerol-3-phosphate acyltransferase
MVWNPIWRFFARVFFKLTGWELDGGKPEPKKYVMIAAPHTSNWDLPYMLATAILADVDLKFMIKYEVIKGPMGWVLKKMGAIPIVRHEKRSTVQQMVDRFNESEELALSVPPEGTRKRTECWKSGFYRIAVEAKIPIMLGYLDYGRKRGSFGIPYVPTGDMTRDMDVIRDWYKDKTGHHPEMFGPIVLEAELAAQQQPPQIAAGG